MTSRPSVMTSRSFVMTSFLLALALVTLAGAEIKLTMVSNIYLPAQGQTVESRKIGSDAVEQLAYDSDAKLVYLAGTGVLHVVNITDVDKPEHLTTQKLPDLDLTDVEQCGDVVMVTVANKSDGGRGRLRVYSKYADQQQGFAVVHDIEVGYLPDSFKITSDCKTVVIAIEAEAYVDEDGVFQDPEGGVVLVKFPDGPTNPKNSITNLNFRMFNNFYDGQQDKTMVRFVTRGFNNNTFSQDVEPEYVTIDEAAMKAYVCLQDNNAIAEVDLQTEEITAINGLGYKEWGYLDASDKDGGISISYWPLRALPLPDAITTVTYRGRRLIITANEGDAKEYSATAATPKFEEETKGKNIAAAQLGDAIPDFVKDALTDDSRLGRLRFSSVDGRDADGTYQALYTYGGRGFSIYDSTKRFTRIYDSGSEVEQGIARECPWVFNANTDGEVDSRSDNKGPESESVAVAELNDRLYVFVGNERPGTISVFSMGASPSDMRYEATWCGGWPQGGNITYLWREGRLTALDPEDMTFVPLASSPAPFPVLLVAGAKSGSLSVLRVDATLEEKNPPATCSCEKP